MNIETKTVKSYSPSPYVETKEDCIKFGWEQTGTERVRSGRTYRTEYILARDKNMPNYATLVRLEGEYFNLKRTLKTYDPMEGSHVLLAFAFFIVPGILYVTFKLKQKKRIQEHNAAVQKQMDAIVAKSKPLL